MVKKGQLSTNGIAEMIEWVYKSYQCRKVMNKNLYLHSARNILIHTFTLFKTYKIRNEKIRKLTTSRKIQQNRLQFLHITGKIIFM